MDGNEQECAQRISDYIDGLVVQEREADIPIATDGDREFRELTGLAQSLLSMKFIDSEAFRGDLLARLPKRAAHEPVGDLWPATVETSFRLKWARLLRRLRWSLVPTRAAGRLAAGMVPLAVVAVLFVWHLAVTQASTAGVLGRADLALSNLVDQNQILSRKWRVTGWTEDARGVRIGTREYLRTEWMDGADFSRVAGRNEQDGRVTMLYSSARDGDEIRAQVYFAPGYYNEARGLLSIEPTRGEFQQALRTFGSADRRKLQAYLNRGYIFEPISGERRFNRSMLENDRGIPAALPRVMVSLRIETLPSGVDVYAVRMIDPARVRFRWTSTGPPKVWLENRETVRFIARDTYLNVRAEETFDSPDGRRTHVVRELLETRIIERHVDGVDPFVIDVPAGTPVRRQSAVEQLKAVADELRHIRPELTH